MKRLAGLLLVLWFASLGSGAIERLHNAQHSFEDARRLAYSRIPGVPDAPPTHDDSNCATHLQLHLPALPAAAPPLLLVLGLCVVFRFLPLPALAAQRAPVSIDCRGPPGV